MVGLEHGAAANLRRALVDVGDRLLTPADEGDMFMSLPNRWRLAGLFGDLLERVALSDRASELRVLVELGNAYALLTNIVDFVAEGQKDPSKVPASMRELEAGLADELANILARRLREAPLEVLT